MHAKGSCGPHLGKVRKAKVILGGERVFWDGFTISLCCMGGDDQYGGPIVNTIISYLENPSLETDH